MCASDRIEWVESPGRGEVVTWTIPHRREGATTTPSYVVAIVELDEGPWMHVHAAAEVALHAGQPVMVTFAPVPEGEPLPVLAAGA